MCMHFVVGVGLLTLNLQHFFPSLLLLTSLVKLLALLPDPSSSGAGFAQLVSRYCVTMCHVDVCHRGMTVMVHMLWAQGLVLHSLSQGMACCSPVGYLTA